MSVELAVTGYDNAGSSHLQHEDALGNSQAVGFGSLSCQVKVRSGDQDSLAVYLKKGKWAETGGSGLSSFTWLTLGAASQRAPPGGARLPPHPCTHTQPASLPSLLCCSGDLCLLSSSDSQLLRTLHAICIGAFTFEPLTRMGRAIPPGDTTVQSGSKGMGGTQQSPDRVPRTTPGGCPRSSALLTFRLHPREVVGPSPQPPGVGPGGTLPQPVQTSQPFLCPHPELLRTSPRCVCMSAARVDASGQGQDPALDDLSGMPEWLGPGPHSQQPGRSVFSSSRLPCPYTFSFCPGRNFWRKA